MNAKKTRSGAAAKLASIKFGEFARLRGRQLMAAGGLKSLVEIDPGTEYRARVQDGKYNEVYLFHIRDEWSTECTCGEQLCAHAALAWSALESPLMRSRLLQKESEQPPPEEGSLEAKLMEALGRNLERAERLWVFGVRRLKEIVLASGVVSFWEVTRTLRLSFPSRANTWDTLSVFMPKSRSDHHFHHSLREALLGAGFTLPDFVLGLPNCPEIAQELGARERAQSIKAWTAALTSAAASTTDLQREKVDLKLMVESGCATFHVRSGESQEFIRPTKAQIARLVEAFHDDALEVERPSVPLWRAFSDQRATKGVPEYSFEDESDLRSLGLLLRDPTMDRLVVRVDGEPLVRETERKAVWIVTDPAAESGAPNYRIELRLTDGSTLPRPVYALPGRPPLYLAAGVVFEGPDPCSGVLRIGQTNQVPAEALETRAGLSLIDRLGSGVPPRLASLIHEDRLRVRVRCGIESASYQRTDMVTLRVEAVATDDTVIERLGGNAWRPVHYAVGHRSKKSAAPDLVLYQRDALGAFPALLDPLTARWDPVSDAFRLRITKKFPDQFAAWLSTIPKDVEVILGPELEGLGHAPVEGKVELNCQSVDVDWFDLRVVVNVEDTTLTKEEVDLLLAARGKFVNLENKGWKRLRFNLSAEEDEHLARLGLSPKELSGQPQRMHALQLSDPAGGGLLPKDQFEEIRARRREITARVAPEVPSSIRAELRPYQLEGFHFLAYLSTNRFGGILADDMGLGKTLQTLTWLAWLRGLDPEDKRTSLVVCPKSVADNWSSEAARFCPDLLVTIFRGAEPELFEKALATSHLVVVNYAQLRGLDGVVQKTDWLAVILDEGQFVKNPQSMTAVIARGLRASHRLVLTGTPIENRLLDLWSLMAFAMPGALGNQQQFVKIYGDTEDPWARRRLSARVRPFLIRRTKTQVAQDLPDRIEEDIFCELEGVQLSLYKAEFKYAQQLLLNVQTARDLDEFRFNFLASIMRLRQICCHPALVMEDGEKVDSAKLDALVELLEPLIAEGQKVLVFSQFVQLLKLVQKRVRVKQWASFILTGETEERGELVKEFQESEGGGVFLISLKAGGFGLNLTAASYVVLFDPWWNPAVENQAIDRTHRIGQQNKVIAYRLLAKNTIEEKIRKLQRTKSALADDVLGEEKFGSGLSMDDLQFLFGEDSTL